MPEGLRKTVLEYLKSHNTMTLATTHDGVPWAATVFYANDGFTLYFLSNPEVCQHCFNIVHNPRVAIAIDEDYPLKGSSDWKKVRGIQMEGIAEMLTAREEINRAVRAYARKYPFTSAYLKSVFSFPLAKKLVAKLKFMAATENKFYKVVPTRVWFVDNEVSFEKRQEVDLEGE